MTMHFREIALEAAATGAIAADEILALRGAGWADGQMDPEEAEALFLANAGLAEPSAQWNDFFAEALCQFIVNTVEPVGSVDQLMSEELLERIDRDGRVQTLAELELLVRVIERAAQSPAALREYAFAQIEEAVLSGEGPTRDGPGDAQAEPGGINAAECAVLRRLMRAPATRAEVQSLFRIKDATLYDSNAPEWDGLFVEGAAGFLLSFDGEEPLEGERAWQLGDFLAGEGAGIGSFVARFMDAGAREAADQGFASLLDLNPLGAGADPDEEDEAEVLVETEQSSLLDHIDADEELDPLEKALLIHIAERTGAGFFGG